MRRSIFHDKANTSYTETGKMSYFKLRNGCLNFKLCANSQFLSIGIVYLVDISQEARIYKIINANMLSHKKDYIQAY